MYTDRTWRHLCFRMKNFNWMYWASKGRRNEKLKGQLEKKRFPHVHRFAWLPTLNVILRERNPKKLNYKTSIFENLEDSCWPPSDLTSIISLVPVIAKCLQENLSKSDFLPVSKTQLSLKPMYMEASAFAKKAPKLPDNYFCTNSNFVTPQSSTKSLLLSMLWYRDFK